MPSFTSSKLVTLTLAIFVICLFFLIPGHTPMEGESNVANVDAHEASNFHLDASFLKNTGETINNALHGKFPGADQTNDEGIDDDEADDSPSQEEVVSKDHSYLKHDPEEDGTEEPEEDTLTDEEKAVQDHHMSNGHGPLRERPKPKKPTKTNKKPAAEHKKIDYDPEVLTDEEQALEAYREAKGNNRPSSSDKAESGNKNIKLKDMERRIRRNRL